MSTTVPEWPTLSRGPVVGSPQFDPIDNTRRSNPEDGPILTQPRFTTQRRRIRVQYVAMTETDCDILEAFHEQRATGSAVFRFQHPTRATKSYYCIIDSISYVMHDEKKTLWKIDVALTEPGGSFQ